MTASDRIATASASRWALRSRFRVPLVASGALLLAAAPAGVVRAQDAPAPPAQQPAPGKGQPYNPYAPRGSTSTYPGADQQQPYGPGQPRPAPGQQAQPGGGGGIQQRSDGENPR